MYSRSLLLFSRPLYPLFVSFKDLEPIVIGSKISTSFDRYARVSSALCLVVIIVSFAAMFFITYIIFSVNLIISLVASLVLSFGIVLPLALSFYMILPKIKYENRKNVLEAKFPLFAMYLSLLFSSGAPTVRVFELLEKKFLKDLIHFDLEIHMINSLAKIGVPLDEVFSRVSMITPSPSVKDLMAALASTARVSGDKAERIREIMSRYIERYSIVVERTVNSMSLILEVYLAFAVMAPVMLGAMASLLLFFPLYGLSFESVAFILVFFIVPVISIMILLIIDSMISRLKV